MDLDSILGTPGATAAEREARLYPMGREAKEYKYTRPTFVSTFAAAKTGDVLVSHTVPAHKTGFLMREEVPEKTYTLTAEDLRALEKYLGHEPTQSEFERYGLGKWGIKSEPAGISEALGTPTARTALEKAYEKLYPEFAGVKYGAAEVGTTWFPALKAAYPQVTMGDISSREWIMTGVNVASLTSPLWLPQFMAGIKGAPIEKVPIGKGVPGPKPVKEPPMIRVKNPWTGLWETKPARLIGYTDAGLPMYEGGQAPLAGFTEIQYTGSGGSTLGIPPRGTPIGSIPTGKTITVPGKPITFYQGEVVPLRPGQPPGGVAVLELVKTTTPTLQEIAVGATLREGGAVATPIVTPLKFTPPGILPTTPLVAPPVAAPAVTFPIPIPPIPVPTEKLKVPTPAEKILEEAQKAFPSEQVVPKPKLGIITKTETHPVTGVTYITETDTETGVKTVTEVNPDTKIVTRRETNPVTKVTVETIINPALGTTTKTVIKPETERKPVAEP